jgi:hypothetical protein
LKVLLGPIFILLCVYDWTLTDHPVIRPSVFIDVWDKACMYSLETPEFAINELNISSTYFLVASYWSSITGIRLLYRIGVFNVVFDSSSTLT